MRADWPSDLVTMLQGDEITSCYLIEMVSRNQQVVRLTDFSDDVTSGANIFKASQNFEMTSIIYQAGGAPVQVAMQLPIDDNGPIYAEDLRRGVWRGGTIRLWLADFTNGNAGLLVDGFVGSVQFTDVLITSVQVLTRGDATADIVLPRIQPKCRHVFGDTYCGFNVASVTVTGTVASVVSNGRFIVTISDTNDLDFTGGAIKMTSGDNDGLASDVRLWTSASSLVELWDNFPLDLAVGDTFQIHAGCGHTRAACAAYSNIDHYGGYDHIPGQYYGGSR